MDVESTLDMDSIRWSNNWHHLMENMFLAQLRVGTAAAKGIDFTLSRVDAARYEQDSLHFT